MDPYIYISLDTLLGITCSCGSPNVADPSFLGYANTIIYICTRHLGHVPWSRRDATSSHNMSASRSRSRADRFQAGTQPGGISMHIQIERYTQPAVDDHDINLARKKSTASGLTDTSSFASIPPAAPGGGSEDFPCGYRESKVGFDFTGARPTRQAVSTNSPSPNAFPDAALPGIPGSTILSPALRASPVVLSRSRHLGHLPVCASTSPSLTAGRFPLPVDSSLPGSSHQYSLTWDSGFLSRLQPQVGLSTPLSLVQSMPPMYPSASTGAPSYTLAFGKYANYSKLLLTITNEIFLASPVHIPSYASCCTAYILVCRSISRSIPYVGPADKNGQAFNY
jgi:hypothetical protein